MAGDDNFAPGTQVIERPFQPTVPTAATATAVGAFIGKANQGPTIPYRVDSWPKFINIYGTNYTDLHNAVSDFFANGGTRCYIQRIVGANSGSAAVDIYASDAPEDPGNPGQVLPGTTPLFSFTARNPGAWGNQLIVTVGARDTVNKRFDISLYNVPSTITFDPAKRNSEYLREQWADLSLDAADSRYIYDIINLPSATGSSNVTVVGQSYDPSTPLVRPYPQTIGSSSFTGGVDGSYVDVSFDSDAAYQAGIDQLSTVSVPLVLNIPNVSDADIIRYAISVAATKQNIFVVIDPPGGKTPNEVVAYANTDLGLGSLGVSQPSFGAVYYPWLYLPALGAGASGRTTLRAPGGAMAGLYMATDYTTGPHQAPAGITARVSGAIDVATTMTQDQLGLLNSNNVNAIKPINGTGIVAYGARTLKRSGKDVYIPVRRNFIYIRESLINVTQFAPFKPNGPKLWDDIRTVCNRFLGGVWSNGGLKGAKQEEAWFVKCDADNNTDVSIDSGFVWVEVGVSLLVPAEFIIISLGQFDGGTTVTTTF